jgi:hypothetical protein
MAANRSLADALEKAQRAHFKKRLRKRPTAGLDKSKLPEGYPSPTTIRATMTLVYKGGEHHEFCDAKGTHWWVLTFAKKYGDSVQRHGCWCKPSEAPSG